MTGRYRFRTCACGTAFRGKLDTCEDCRLGRRADTLEFRRSRRGPGAAHTLRQYQQRRKREAARP